MSSDSESLDERIRFAIANRRLLEIRYAGTTRVVEPHDYGVLNGHERLLVYQRRGPARPGHPRVGWRLLDPARIDLLVVLEDGFEGSRGQSHSTHHEWDRLYARVR